MIKKFLIGVLSLLLIVGLGLYLVGSNLDGIIKRGVEKYGTMAAGAPVSIRNVQLDLSSGKVTLEGFNLGNPTGFSDQSAMKFGVVAIEVDPKSVTETGPILIKNIIIDAPELTYEVIKSGDSNLQKIQDNVRIFASSISSEGKTATSETKTNGNQSAERKIIVEHLTVSNGSVKLSHALLAGTNLVDAKLPTIEMYNIGKDSGGITSAELSQILLQKISAKSIEVGQRNLAGELGKQGIESLKGAVEQSEIGKAIGGFLGK
ncbi:MAG: hypothetical protein EOM37_00795 [Proteobacteria bacterium]|jgi:hypothetical protein|nr:hypothetical protein [Alphaproteobacteria bacterium]NCC02577.1 hypothetical protein [Pseudomonadota bacterium]